MASIRMKSPISTRIMFDSVKIRIKQNRKMWFAIPERRCLHTLKYQKKVNTTKSKQNIAVGNYYIRLQAVRKI